MPRETKQQAGRGMGRRMHALGVLVVLPTALSDETGTDLPTYKIGCNTMNRFDCNAACTDAGWTMLCIQNAQQNNFIWGETGERTTWLGYSDKKIEGTVSPRRPECGSDGAQERDQVISMLTKSAQ